MEPANPSVLSYEQLQSPPAIDETLAGQLDMNMLGVHWLNSFQCITMLRMINKHRPECADALFLRYASAIQSLFAAGRRQVVNNIICCLKELFQEGQRRDLSQLVGLFLPGLLRKAATEFGSMRDMLQETITVVVFFCEYEATLLLSCEISLDRQPIVGEFSLRFLGALLERVKERAMSLSEKVLLAIMHTLMNLINGKRNNMRNLALDISIQFCRQIGSPNYLQLMMFSLTPAEVYAMGQSMESHRVMKIRPEPLSSLKKRVSVVQNYDEN